ncbi:hypothetical protein FF1_041819 [Malus domestica]
MSYLDGEVGWESLVESEMNRDVTVKKVIVENMKGWRHIALNRARWASEGRGVRDIDRKLVKLDKVVDGAGGEAGGVGAESELGRAGQDKRVVDGNYGVGGGGRHDMVGLLVPHHRAILEMKIEMGLGGGVRDDEDKVMGGNKIKVVRSTKTHWPEAWKYVLDLQLSIKVNHVRPPLA